MVETPRAFITYQPPDWGQPVRPKDIRGAYVAIQHFLKHCTGWQGADNSSTLVVHEPGQDSPPDYDHRRVIALARESFGPGERQEALRKFPDTGYVEHKHEWRLPADMLERAVDLVASLPRWSPKYISPVLLSVAFDFHLCNPRTGEPLPHQGTESRIQQWPESSGMMLHLSSTPAASFDLRFPFEEPNRPFLSYLGAALPYLPVQVAWNRFRLMVPNQRGTNYVARKIDAEVFDQLKACPTA